MVLCGPRGHGSRYHLCCSRQGFGGAGRGGIGANARPGSPAYKICLRATPFFSPPPGSQASPAHPPSLLLVLPCLSTSSPFSPQRGGVKHSPKHSMPRINPSVASYCTWTKTQAPSVGSQRALPNSSISSLLPGASSATLASFLFLRCTSCSWYLEVSSHRAPMAGASDSCFYCKGLSLEGKMGSSQAHLSPLFIYFPALFTYLVTDCLLSTCYVPGTVQALG